MKKNYAQWVSISLLLAAVGAWNVEAAPTTFVRVVKDTTTWIPIDLNSQTVFCTERGYGTVQLKVSVPDLDWLAHFDHRVEGEGLPCITAGQCQPGGLDPKDVIDQKKRFEIIPLRVVLKEVYNIDDSAKTCVRTLSESVFTQIRGKPFNHFKFGSDAKADFEACKIAQTLI